MGVDKDRIEGVSYHRAIVMTRCVAPSILTDVAGATAASRG